MISQFRIDERLAHGAVVVGWIKFLGTTHLMIVNDDVVNNTFEKEMMLMGIPQGIKTMFCTIEKAAEILNDPRSAPHKIFVIVKSPTDAIRMVDAVKEIQHVNFSNFGLQTDIDPKTTKRLFTGLNLDAENIELLRVLKTKVKEVYRQQNPSVDKYQVNP